MGYIEKVLKEKKNIAFKNYAVGYRVVPSKRWVVKWQALKRNSH